MKKPVQKTIPTPTKLLPAPALAQVSGGGITLHEITLPSPPYKQ